MSVNLDLGFFNLQPKPVFRGLVPLIALSVSMMACSSSSDSGGSDNDTADEHGACLDQAEAITAAPSKSYLMSFHSADVAAGPDTHKTWIVESDDFIHWSLIPGYQAFCGSVPDLIRRDTSLYVFNAGIMRRLDYGTLQWDATVQVTVRSSAGGDEIDYFMVDVTPFLGADGLIHLYYLKNDLGTGYDPAGCGPSTTCTKTFESATEVSGSGGTEYVVDSGSRVQVVVDEADVAAMREGGSDPDFFRGASGEYYLAVMGGPESTYLFTATGMTDSFAPIGGLGSESLITGSLGAVPSALYDSSGSRYIWAFTKPGSQITLYSSTSASTSLDGVGAVTQLVNLTGGSFPDDIGSDYQLNSAGLTKNSASGE